MIPPVFRSAVIPIGRHIILIVLDIREKRLDKIGLNACTGNLVSGFPRFLQGGKQHSHKNRNDGNNDQQLDQCKKLLHLFILLAE